MSNNIYESATTMSYQSFKKVRNISKLMMIAGIINFIMMLIGIATYKGEIVDPRVLEWANGLSAGQFALAMIMSIVGITGMCMFASMNHGSNVKKCYKRWCDEHGYAPYNACKH